jgi:hypothetical protein
MLVVKLSKAFLRSLGILIMLVAMILVYVIGAAFMIVAGIILITLIILIEILGFLFVNYFMEAKNAQDDLLDFLFGMGKAFSNLVDWHMAVCIPSYRVTLEERRQQER